MMRLFSTGRFFIFGLAMCFSLPAYSNQPKLILNKVSDEHMALVRRSVVDWADAGDTYQTELRGVKAFYFAVYYRQDGKHGTKPTESEIADPLVLKMRTAGLKVVPPGDTWAVMDNYMHALAKGGNQTSTPEELPLIELDIWTNKGFAHTTAVSVNTHVSDYALLTRDLARKRLVNIWQTQDVDTDVVKSSGVHDEILKMSVKQIDEFLTTWQKQNGL